MSMLAEKFNYCPLTRPKVLCFHSASLLSTPMLVTSRSECQGAGVENGKMVPAQGISKFPQEENLAYVLPPALFHSPLLEIPQTSDWAKSGFAWQRMHSFTKLLLSTRTQVKEYGDKITQPVILDTWLGRQTHMQLQYSVVSAVIGLSTDAHKRDTKPHVGSGGVEVLGVRADPELILINGLDKQKRLGDVDGCSKVPRRGNGME